MDLLDHPSAEEDDCQDAGVEEHAGVLRSMGALMPKGRMRCRGGTNHCWDKHSGMRGSHRLARLLLWLGSLLQRVGKSSRDDAELCQREGADVEGFCSSARLRHIA